jgi:hypothetical protein
MLAHDITGLVTCVIPVFAMLLAKTIMGPSRPWSDGYLFSALNGLPTALSAADASNVKTRLGPLASYLRTSLEGRSTRSVGREPFGR